MASKLFLLGALLTSALFGYSDSDLDGVSDTHDVCPNTPIEAVVDAKGCPMHTNDYSLILGAQHSSGTYGGTQIVATRNALLTLAYDSVSWGAMISGSYFSSGASDPNVAQGGTGLGDTYVGLSYHQMIKDAMVTYFGTVKLATASTEIGTGAHDTTLGVAANVPLGRIMGFVTLGYTITGDTGTATYNDIKNASLGLGMTLNPSWFIASSYNYADAYIEGSHATQSVGIFSSYAFSKRTFATINYGYGLSSTAADHLLGVSVGSHF